MKNANDQRKEKAQERIAREWNEGMNKQENK